MDHQRALPFFRAFPFYPRGFPCQADWFTTIDHLPCHCSHLLGRTGASSRLDRRSMGLGNDSLSLGTSHRSCQSCSHIRVSFFFCQTSAYLCTDTSHCTLQYLDQVYSTRNPWIFRFHDGFPTSLRLDCSNARLLARVHEHRRTSMVVACLLAHNLWLALCFAHSRLCLEIVRSPSSSQTGFRSH